MSDEPRQPQGEPSGPFGRFFSSRPEGSPYPKAEVLPRVLARLTDFVLAAFFPIAAGDAGAILAVLFVLFADGMLHGQSPGKRLLGIKVVHVPTCRDADYRESALRNFPFALVLLLQMVPTFGQFLLWTVGPAVLLFEAARVFGDKLGLRAGDLFAETQVVDTKVLAGVQTRPVLKAVRSGEQRGAARVAFEPPGSEPR